MASVLRRLWYFHLPHESMKKLFKQFYLRIRLGKNYRERIQNAIRFGWMLEDSSGTLNNFYNFHGEQIRGWHHNHKRQIDNTHPLIKKYS